MTKIIGVYADSINGELKQTAPYINFIKHFGQPRLITQFDKAEEVVKNCDMLLIPGGPDVNPMRYGEIPEVETGRCNIQYEYLDSVMIPAFIEAKKPIVGICRGFQSLNVVFGGTLFQDMKGHNQLQEGFNRYDTHDDLITESGKIYKINTIHHQAIKKLGDDLKPIGWSPVLQNCKSLKESQYLTSKNYGKKSYLSFVEAFEHKTLPIVALQYHPEEFDCPFAIEKINNILNK